MPLPFSTGEIDRLGERLRGSPTAADYDQLAKLREAHEDPLRSTYALLNSRLLQFKMQETAYRVKTVQTTIDKLRRQEKTRLSQIDDIAGVRIVLDPSYSVDKQDEVVEAVTQAFPSSTVRDRREQPSHGYRALHVIARHEASASRSRFARICSTVGPI